MLYVCYTWLHMNTQTEYLIFKLKDEMVVENNFFDFCEKMKTIQMVRLSRDQKNNNL